MNKVSETGSARRAEPFNTHKKFVRVRELRPDRFVEFDFAIGDPDLYVEMMLTAEAFDEFCAVNHVIFLQPADVAAPDPQQWRLSQTTGRQFGGGTDPTTS